MTHPDTFVKSSHKGFGLFAGRDFKRGEILWLIDDYDVKIPLHEYNNLDREQRRKLDIYTYMDFQYRVIVPWDDGKYVNHSCEPNCTGLSQFDNLSVALRDIKEGEEIVEDYTSYFAHFETFNCECGSKNCCGIISSELPYQAHLRLNLSVIGPVINCINQYLLGIKTKENSDLTVLLANLVE
jgi:SET domain-containing protein